MPSTNSSRIASPVGDAIERLVQVRVDLVERLDAEDAALAARVGRLEHGREPDLVGGAPRLGDRPHARRSAAAARPRRRAGVRIAILCVIRCAVSTPIPGSPRASATAATTGTARSALTVITPSSLIRAVALSTAAASEKSTTFAMSASARPGRVRVAVDRDHAQAELLRLQDRAALVAPGADEEDGLHAERMLLRRQRDRTSSSVPSTSTG